MNVLEDNLTENFSAGETENAKSQTISCCDLTSFLLGTAVAHQFCMEGCSRTSAISSFASGGL